MTKDLAPASFGIDTGADLREKISALEQAMLAMPKHHVVIEPKHVFADGLYAREIFIPKGTTLTGKIHKTEHISVISQGDISVLTENGIERIQAPRTIIAKPGTKRVGYAHEDTVWITFHATRETDLEKLEVELIAASHEELEGSKDAPLLEGA